MRIVPIIVAIAAAGSIIHASPRRGSLAIHVQFEAAGPAFQVVDHQSLPWVERSICSKAGVCSQSFGGQRLRLTRVRSLELGEKLVPTGAALANEGWVLVWDNRTGLMFLESIGGFRAVPVEGIRRITQARFGNRNDIEIVDGGAQRIIRIDRAGRVLETLTFRVPVVVQVAVHTAWGWVVGGPTVNRVFQIWLVGRSPRQLWEWPAFSSAHIASDSKNLAVAQFGPPHSLQVIESARGRPFPANSGGAKGFPVRYGDGWVTAGIISIEGNYLQSLGAHAQNTFVLAADTRRCNGALVMRAYTRAQAAQLAKQTLTMTI